MKMSHLWENKFKTNTQKYTHKLCESRVKLKEPMCVVRLVEMVNGSQNTAKRTKQSRNIKRIVVISV